LIAYLSLHPHFVIIHKVPPKKNQTPKIATKLLCVAFLEIVEDVLVGKGGLLASRLTSSTIIRTRFILAPTKIILTFMKMVNKFGIDYGT
jgi:hypothetical protein